MVGAGEGCEGRRADDGALACPDVMLHYIAIHLFMLRETASAACTLVLGTIRQVRETDGRTEKAEIAYECKVPQADEQ